MSLGFQHIQNIHFSVTGVISLYNYIILLQRENHPDHRPGQCSPYRHCPPLHRLMKCRLSQYCLRPMMSGMPQAVPLSRLHLQPDFHSRRVRIYTVASWSHLAIRRGVPVLPPGPTRPDESDDVPKPDKLPPGAIGPVVLPDSIPPEPEPSGGSICTLEPPTGAAGISLNYRMGWKSLLQVRFQVLLPDRPPIRLLIPDLLRFRSNPNRWGRCPDAQHVLHNF